MQDEREGGKEEGEGSLATGHYLCGIKLINAHSDQKQCEQFDEILQTIFE